MKDASAAGADVEKDLIELLKCMRYISRHMSNALKDFSSNIEGPLRIHAVMASNRLKLIAEDLYEGLIYIGADPEIKDFKEVREKFGGIALDVVDKLEKSLEALKSGGYGNPGSVGDLLKEFDDALVIAINWFNTFNSILSDHPDEKMRVLGIILRNMVDDFKVIKRRHDELIWR